jgi:protein-L-isoaspartate(D-aspartate) O-methyltransferase
MDNRPACRHIPAPFFPGGFGGCLAPFCFDSAQPSARVRGQPDRPRTGDGPDDAGVGDDTDDHRHDRLQDQRPIDSRDKFVAFMKETRKEDPKMLAWRFDRAQAMIENKDVWREKELRAYLLTPREEFVLDRNRARAYDHAFLDIGYGVTISGPHLVGRMTSTIDVQPTDRVLEIGTGSGYQSALLSHLSDQVYTIEIIDPLGKRSAANYVRLIAAGYPEFANIHTKIADGYFGWAEAAPFDKIIVTCGIDHIPPSLLQQLKTGGIMVIPVGPPGRQHVLEVKKVADAAGKITVTRRDIYNGKIVNFVPFTKAGGGSW